MLVTTATKCGELNSLDVTTAFFPRKWEWEGVILMPEMSVRYEKYNVTYMAWMPLQEKKLLNKLMNIDGKHSMYTLAKLFICDIMKIAF